MVSPEEGKSAHTFAEQTCIRDHLSVASVHLNYALKSSGAQENSWPPGLLVGDSPLDGPVPPRHPPQPSLPPTPPLSAPPPPL
jgi:hypothetical protein